MSEHNISTKITKDDNGTYRWIYELDMFKSFFLLFEVWKVLIIAFAIVFLLSVIINLLTGNGIDGIIGSFKVIGICLVIIMVISLPAYYIVTKANNDKYTVLFEMDEEGIDHIQIKTDKAITLDSFVTLAGIATRNRSAAGAGILSASGTSLYSEFRNVRRIKTNPDKNMIVLKGRFISNQIYVDLDDYDFVVEYILKHCKNASVN